MHDKESRARTVCLVVLTVIAFGAALYVLRPVLVPFVLALFLVAGIAPVLGAIETRFGAPRILAVGITFVLGVGLLVMLWTLVRFSVASLADNAATYKNRLGELVDRVESWIPANVLPSGETPADESNDGETSGVDSGSG